MRLLVLGGTRFVGRAVIEEALARGWDVTAVHRGLTGALPPAVRVLFADRTDRDALSESLRDGRWDAVVDTWSGAPRVVSDAARVLAARVSRYGYVSSASVYAWGRHIDESSPLVDGDLTAADGDYPALERGAELGVMEAFTVTRRYREPGLSPLAGALRGRRDAGDAACGVSLVPGEEVSMYFDDSGVETA